MSFITWINPAEQDHCAEDPNWKVEVTANTDQWGNHSRMWVATKKHEKDDAWTEIVRIHSGTDGVSVCTKSRNNGHAHIPPSIGKAMAKELKNAHSYARKKGRQWRDYWRWRNSGGDKPNY